MGKSVVASQPRIRHAKGKPNTIGIGQKYTGSGSNHQRQLLLAGSSSLPRVVPNTMCPTMDAIFDCLEGTMHLANGEPVSAKRTSTTLP
ncbi:hypothetical protein SAMN06269173_101547 [Hymenobacter mucosus]|uniref:Uncharacterized protein n=1 Tax=Hymenobacter mucosus TaxID=1411120 RepID=A0A238VFA7_9BACT|nr:hypothetical protein SAMN06269173_101547 [Hymenobacter mucosus]